MAKFKIQNIVWIVLLMLIARGGAARTPPGIANNPSNARCLDDKFKQCFNLEHVCPKFCPDSCTVDCQSCKPICGGSPTLTPPDTESSPESPTHPTPNKPPTPLEPTPEPHTPPTPTTQSPKPSTPLQTPPSPSVPTPTPSSPTPSTPTPTPSSPTPSSPTPTPATPTHPIPTPTPSTPTPSTPTPTPSTPTPSSPTPTPSTPTPSSPTPTPSSSTPSTPTPSSPTPSSPTPTPATPTPPIPIPTPSTPTPSTPTPSTPTPSSPTPKPSTPTPSSPTPTPSSSTPSTPTPSTPTPSTPTPTPSTPTPSTPTPSSSTPSTPTPSSPTPSTPTPTPSSPTPTTPTITPTPSTPTPTTPSPTPSTPTPSTPTPTPPTPSTSPSPPPPPSPPTPTPSPPTSTPTPPLPDQTEIASEFRMCRNRNFPQCFNVKHACPIGCPDTCEVDCVTCKPVCKCDIPGAVCQDPRFIGGDGITFYFHGKKDQHFCLVTDPNLHINARFIGKRNQNMKRDFTWVQSIGILFDNHKLYVAAQETAKWDDSINRLVLSFDEKPIHFPETEGAIWQSQISPKTSITRVSNTNNVVIEVKGIFKITAQVVPIGERESRVHNYGITRDNCFAHLDLGFKFYAPSDQANGVLGQTYRNDYVSHINVGATMPLLGGDKDFENSNIYATDCNVALFRPNLGNGHDSSLSLELPSLRCSSRRDGEGVLCKR